MDDDFLFNSKTKIEVLVDVLEKTELDVVRGCCQIYPGCNLQRQPREGRGGAEKRGMYVREEEKKGSGGRGAEAGDE